MNNQDQKEISCRICGSNTFAIGEAKFGRMYIKCTECNDRFVIGPDITVKSIIDILKDVSKEYNKRKEDILYNIIEQSYPIYAKEFLYMEPIKNNNEELEMIKFTFNDDVNVELSYIKYKHIIDDYIRHHKIKELMCDDCGQIWFDHVEDGDEYVPPACPICGSGMILYGN